MQVFLVIFAICTIASSWAAWRRSPLYSTKITLELVAIFLLIVPTVIFGTIAIVGGPLRNSPTAQAIFGCIAAGVIGAGATGLIIRATDAHVAQLPQSVRVLTTERHKVQRWIWRIVSYVLIAAAATWALPGDWAWLPGISGVLLLVGSAPTLMALYMRARRVDLGMSQVMGAPWAHWQYTAEEWEAWCRHRLDEDLAGMRTFYWKRDWRKTRVAFITFAVGACVLPYGSIGNRLAIFAGLMAFLAIMGSGVNWNNRNECQRNYRILLAAPRETYFGDEGVFCNGKYLPWIFSGSYLVGANAPRDSPACVELSFLSYYGTTEVQETKKVLIPAGGEANLSVLQQKLHERCRKASIHLLAPA